MFAPIVTVPFTIPLEQGPMPAWLDRLVAVGLVATATLCTWQLASVSPDPRGYDTHVQLGMVPCSWPVLYGIPCPTCGATTAACLLVHGQPLRAIYTQPFGATVAAVGLLAGGFALFCLLRRRSLFDVIARLYWGRITLGTIALLLAAWLYKYLMFAT